MIPNLEEKRKSIEFLKNCDFKSVSEKIIFEHLDIIIKGFSFDIAVTISGIIVYRGIKFPGKPSHRDQLIYPPQNLAKVNRASAEGQQMFYCSNLKKAPFYELFVKKGDRIVLSTWMLKERMVFPAIGYKSVGNSDIISSESGSDANTENNNYVGDFLNTAFSKKILPEDAYNYKLTNAIAKLFLSIEATDVTDYNRAKLIPRNDGESEKFILPQISGLYYPTIKNTELGENFAMKKEVVDDGLLEIEKVEYIEITDIIDNKYQYKILDIAFEINDDEIVWKKLDRQWLLFDDTEDINFVDDNGVFEAFTSNGEEIFPI